jgi:hypothetical protein
MCQRQEKYYHTRPNTASQIAMPPSPNTPNDALNNTSWHALMEQAQDPTCPAQRLVQINQATDEMSATHPYQVRWAEVRRHVAQNPNAPPTLLQALFTDEGETPLYQFVLQNPAFELVLIERPDFFHTVNSRLLLRLLYRAQLPPMVWAWLQQHGHPNKNVQEAIRDRQETEKMPEN